MENLKKKIDFAKGKIEADLVFKNGKIIDVFNGKIIEKDLAISDGLVIGFGSYKGIREVDLNGKYISPALIDAHVHIESSMSSPLQCAKALIPNGVTTIIADPHEISNVAGKKGISYILDATEDLPLDVRVMVPSCVPATPFENSGGILTGKDLLEFKNKDRVLGLGEMMNYVGVVENDPDVIEKLHGFSDRIIDGHAPSLKGEALNAYRISGVVTDHECSNLEEMEDRIARGMYVIIREGTAAKNARALVKGITKENISRCMFCTDDKHPEDLLKEGSVNKNVQIAIEEGLDPIDAIKLASINPALAYGLKNKGAIAPGYEANLLILDSLEDFTISEVYIKGEKFAENKKLVKEITLKNEISLYSSVNIYDYKLEDFRIRLKTNKARVIGVIPGELVTEKLEKEVTLEEGNFIPGNDLLKFLVIERHKGLKSIGKGIIKGIGLKNGAIASTIAHDSHNLIIVGDSDEDMFIAMKEIEKIQGGIVLVKDKKVLKSLPLEIGGLMSNKPLEEINENILEIMEVAYGDLGITKEIDPIITLGFMALPVIPHIKLTDKGLFDVDNFTFVDLEVK